MMRSDTARLFYMGLVVTAFALVSGCSNDDEEPTLDEELTELVEQHGGLTAFSLPDGSDLTAIPADPLNPLSEEKVALGQLLFHETGLTFNPEAVTAAGTYSCATCHHADGGFQAAIPQGLGEGGSGFGQAGEARVLAADYGFAAGQTAPDVQPIRTPAALNVAYQTVMLWNGQFGATGANLGTDAQWTDGTPKAINQLGYEGVEVQAIAGLSVHRLMNLDPLIEDPDLVALADYAERFNQAFPDQANPMTRENAGLAIAAYERTLLANQAPFQRWLSGEASAMTDQEKRGALLFFGKGACVACHTGPALSSAWGADEVDMFFSIGMADLDPNDPQVHLAAEGVDEATAKGRGGFTLEDADNDKFKVPQLYNLKDSPFYGHGASFSSVREVLEYKNNAEVEDAAAENLDPRFVALGLSSAELADLTVFLTEALYDANLDRYVPETLPTGNCFPVADLISVTQIPGC